MRIYAANLSRIVRTTPCAQSRSRDDTVSAKTTDPRHHWVRQPARGDARRCASAGGRSHSRETSEIIFLSRRHGSRQPGIRGLSNRKKSKGRHIITSRSTPTPSSTPARIWRKQGYEVSWWGLIWRPGRPPKTCGGPIRLRHISDFRHAREHEIRDEFRPLKKSEGCIKPPTFTSTPMGVQSTEKFPSTLRN